MTYNMYIYSIMYKLYFTHYTGVSLETILRVWRAYAVPPRTVIIPTKVLNGLYIMPARMAYNYNLRQK